MRIETQRLKNKVIKTQGLKRFLTLLSIGTHALLQREREREREMNTDITASAKPYDKSEIEALRSLKSSATLAPWPLLGTFTSSTSQASPSTFVASPAKVVQAFPIFIF